MEEEIEIDTVEDDVWYIEERDLEEYRIIEEMYEGMELDEKEEEQEDNIAKNWARLEIDVREF